MKKASVIFFLFIITTCLSFSQTYEAESLPQNQFQISVGAAVPATPEGFTKNWNVGFNIGLGVEVPITPAVRFLMTADYSACGMDYDALFGPTPPSVEKEGGTLNLFSIAANLKLNAINDPASVSPYALGGIGYFDLSASDFIAKSGSSSVKVTFTGESAFSAQIGAGLDIPINEENKSVFIELRYVMGFTEGDITAYVPVKAGFKFGF